MPAAPYKIIREQVNATGTELINIYCRYGGNFFVFSYPKDGTKNFTLIDTGDMRQAANLPAILTESGVNPANIERVIITHSHPDHYGLAHLIVKNAQTKILVHAGFKSIVDTERTEFERNWLGLFNPHELKKLNVEYLSPQNDLGYLDIGGLKFRRITLPMQIGQVGKLEIFAVPESPETHTHDQVIVLYSVRDYTRPYAPVPQGYRPSDEMVFSGDLWLMRGPIFDRKVKSFSFYFRRTFFRFRRLFQGKGFTNYPVMEQDLAVKEALKGFFSLVKVKPGHGEEFLGSRILPLGLPADRDLFNMLGINVNADGLPNNTAQDDKLKNLLEQAYQGFKRELEFWQKQGYTRDEIAGFLVRIYNEQTGGGKAVVVDRKQRRERMKSTLIRLQNDITVTPEMRNLALLALGKLPS
jgi:hypothetical protein